MPEENLTQSIAEPSQERSASSHKEKLDSIRNSFKDSVRKAKMKKTGLIVSGVIAAGALILLVVYILGGGGDGIFRSPLIGGEATLTGENKVVNPLTGEIFSRRQAKDWVEVRPLAVMINNHIDARPQSGLIYADLVYEIVAEGGITRLLPFYKSTIPEKIGPVRSTREYYLVLVKELGDAALMHIGWSPQALAAIESWPVRSLGRGGGQFWRDNPNGVAVEHTAYVNGKDLLETGVDLGWEGTREYKVWEFKEEKSGYDSAPSASDIAIDFWHRGDYSAIFDYDTETNTYLRSMGYDENDNPIPHNDRENNEQVTVKNLLVQFVEESPIVNDPKGRLDYELVGSGTGLVFVDGRVIEVTWNKEERDSRTIFYDSDGEEMKFNRGKFWISVVPDRNIEQVVYN
jgi:hypothetical protein